MAFADKLACPYIRWRDREGIPFSWRGYAGCESLAISNWLRRRDGQVGCLVFWPLDAVEVRVAGNTMIDAAR